MSDRRRLLLSPLWLLIALISILGVNATSATAGRVAETRVRANPTITVDSVAAISSERPASVGCLRPSQPGFVSGSCVATNTVDDAFHHTTSRPVDAIRREGLFPGSYATPTKGLSPLQAHIELALNPAGGARNAVLQIDVAGLRVAGYEIPAVTRVTGANGMAGGGWEMQFPYAIPPEFIKVIEP